MGELISLFSESGSDIQPEQLITKIGSQLTRRRVAKNIRYLCQLPAKSRIPFVPLAVVPSREHYPRGYLDHEKRDGELKVLTDTNFARALVRHADLDSDTAVTVVADFACAYGSIVKRMDTYFSGKGAQSGLPLTGFRQEDWSPNFAAWRLRSLPHRVAGAVALASQGVDFAIGGLRPFPPHLAGLANPLPESAMAGLGQIFNNKLQ